MTTDNTKFASVIPAVPGTTVSHYNGYWDTTQEQPVLFWGISYEGDDPTPYVVPFTFDAEGGQATPISILEGGSDGRESGLVAFHIPGWGRLPAVGNSPIFGNFLRQVKGYDPNF